MPVALVSAPAPISGGLARWREILSHHYLRLSPKSRRLRFLSPLADYGVCRVADTARPASVIGIKVDGHVRAVFEIFPLPNGHAEIGMSVEDDYQGQGYGRNLFLSGMQEARRLGVDTADFYFASDNQGIKSLLYSVGARVCPLGSGDSCAEVDIEKALALRS